MYRIGSVSADPQNFWYQIGLVLKKLFRCIPNFDTILKNLTWFHYSFSTVSTDCKDITGQSHPVIKINNINGSLITASKKSGCQKNVVIFRIHQLNLGHFFIFYYWLVFFANEVPFEIKFEIMLSYAVSFCNSYPILKIQIHRFSKCLRLRFL